MVTHFSRQQLFRQREARVHTTIALSFALMPHPRTIVLLGLLGLAAACQEGGNSSNASSEVKLDIDHFMAAFGGKAQFDEGFPLEENDTYTDLATLHFKDTGKYQLWRIGQKDPTPPNPYFLEKDGDLTIIVSQSKRSSLRWPGYYDRTGNTYFFVSRTQGFLRAFFGVRQMTGIPDVAGSWHVLGETLVFAATTAKPTHDRVGRAFKGTLTVDATGKITAGLWKDSSGSSVLVTGTLKGSTLGNVDAALELKGGPATGARSFSGGLTKNLGVLMDRVATDGNVGPLVMVRQNPDGIDKKKVVGEWHMGLHAIFNRPVIASGVNTAEGILTFTDTTWKFVLNNPIDTFEGTWSIGSTGDLTLREKEFNQDWVGAIDLDHKTLVLVDRTTEGGGTSGTPWVGFFFGLKRTSE